MAVIREVSSQEFERWWIDARSRRVLGSVARSFATTIRDREDRDSLQREALWQTLRYHREGAGRTFYGNLWRFARLVFCRDSNAQRDLRRGDRAWSKTEEIHDQETLGFQDLISRLPARIAVAVELRLMYSYSDKEVAAVLGVSPERVRRIWAVAVRDLRFALKGKSL